MARVIENTLSEAGARRLQRVIQQYWAHRGKRPEVRVELVGDFGLIWQVRSNMVNGMPQEGRK